MDDFSSIFALSNLISKLNNKMRLSAKALKAINTPDIRRELSGACKCTEQTIIRYIHSNNVNLTWAAALEVIRKETGLSDSEILVSETEVADQRS